VRRMAGCVAGYGGPRGVLLWLLCAAGAAWCGLVHWCDFVAAISLRDCAMLIGPWISIGPRLIMLTITSVNQGL